MKLKQADLVRLSQTIQSLYSAQNVTSLNTCLLEKVHSLIPSDTTAVTLVPLNGQAIVYHNAQHLAKIVSERIWALRQYLGQHPLESVGEISAHWGATCLSDFLSRGKLHRTDLYNEFYRHVDVEYQLGIYTERVNGFRIGVSCNAKAKDFGARERDILTHLSPHIAQAYQNAFAMTKIRRTATSFEAAAEAHRHGFIRIRRDGNIADMTSLAGDFLRKYFDHPPSTRKTLPKDLQAWISSRPADETIAQTRPALVVAKGAATLVIRSVAEGDYLILLLAEQQLPPRPIDLAPLGLRPRECEILFWMCQAKSNPEIATILGVSVRTIHKHNENIFRKLGVENRHAATLLAAPLLRHL